MSNTWNLLYHLFAFIGIMTFVIIIIITLIYFRLKNITKKNKNRNGS